MPIIVANIRQNEIKKLDKIFSETMALDNLADDNSINLGNHALHHQLLLSEAIRGAIREQNIYLEGDDNIRIVNDARAFINEYYGQEVCPLEPVENVALEAEGWSILSVLGYICCCFVHAFQQRSRVHMSGELGFDNHDYDSIS